MSEVKEEGTEELIVLRYLLFLRNLLQTEYDDLSNDGADLHIDLLSIDNVISHNKHRDRVATRYDKSMFLMGESRDD